LLLGFTLVGFSKPQKYLTLILNMP